MTTSSPQLEFYFDDPRLRMTIPGRMLVRTAGWIGYVFTAAATITFFVSGAKGLQALGILLVLFLGDLFIHRADGERLISEGVSGVGGLRRLPLSGRVNLSDYMGPAAFAVIEESFDRATLTGHDFYLESALRLLKAREVHDGLQRLDVSVEEFKQKLEELTIEGKTKDANASKADRIVFVEMLVGHGFEKAAENGHKFIEPADLFAALASIESIVLKKVFELFSVVPADLEKALIFGGAHRSFVRPRRSSLSIGGFVYEAHKPLRHRIMNRAWTSRPTPTLDAHSADFTDLARQGRLGFLVGHQAEYERVVDALARPVNPNVLLVGEVGMGKETLIAHLAFEITKDKVPAPLFDKHLVELHISSLVAGASQEELQLRLKKMVEEIYLAGNIILYVPDIHNLVKTSGTAFISAADALMPIIMNNMFPIIGATKPKEFKEFIEPRSDFVAGFEVVRVDEIKEDEAEKILVYEAVVLERDTGVLVSFGAVKRAVSLAKKYVRTKFLPSSAEEVLKDAVVRVAREGGKDGGAERGNSRGGTKGKCADT